MVGLLYGILDCVRWVIICKYILEMRTKDMHPVRLIGGSLALLGCYVWQYCIPDDVIPYTFYILSQLTVCFIWLCGPTLQKLTKLIFAYILDNLCSILISFVFMAVFPQIDVYNDTAARFIINLLATSGIFALSYAFYRNQYFHEMYHCNSSSKRIVILAVLDLIGCTFVVGGIQLILDDAITKRLRILVGTGIVILCIVILIFSILHNLLFQSQKYYQEQYHYIQKIMELKQQYYTAQLYRNNEIDGFRHDLKKHIYAIQGLLAEGKLDQMQSYMEELTKQIYVSTGNSIQCGNEIIDIIMQDMQIKCSKAEIAFSVQGRFTSALHISDADICTIVGNLMDNAYEACIQVQVEPNIQMQTEPSIQVQLGENENTFVIHIENSGNIENTKANARLHTTKKQSDHGLGIRLIQQAVKRNHGLIRWQASNYIFTTDLIFYKKL